MGRCLNFAQRLLRLAAWLTVPALAVAYWTPGEDMVRTGAGGEVEHFAVFPIVTALFVLAYPAWSPYRIATGLMLYAGFLELGQLYAPGRHAQFDTFAASCLGVALVIGPTLLWRPALR